MVLYCEKGLFLLFVRKNGVVSFTSLFTSYNYVR